MKTNLCLLAALPLALLASASAQEAAHFPASVEAFLNQHCLDCHDDLSTKGDLDLTALNFDLGDPQNFNTWATVFKRVAGGDMPPKDETRPDEASMNGFLDNLSKNFATVELQRRQANGRALLRRLNRSEYENTLKDLLALPFLDFAKSLPAEGSAHGFDKSAEALDFSHIHATRLMEVADEALRMAIAPAREKPESQTIRVEVNNPQRMWRELPGFHRLLNLSSAMPLTGMEVDETFTLIRGGFLGDTRKSVSDQAPFFDAVAIFINSELNLRMEVWPFKIPVAGYYKIRVNGFGVQNNRGKLAPSDRVETIGFYSEDRTLGYVDLPAYQPTTGELTVWLEPDDVIKPLVASSSFARTPVASLVKGDREIGQNDQTFRRLKSNGVAFRWFELEGPLYEEWPPQSHRRLFDDLEVEMGRRPSTGKGKKHERFVKEVSSEAPLADARRLMKRFVEEALRRPVTEDDLKIPMDVVNEKLKRNESFMESMISGYRAVLTTPDFLLMNSKTGALDSYALAERLSYFLSGTTPDSGLRQLAASGEILDPETLRAQVERLLNDDRSQRFVEHFLDKWLKLEDIELTEPDGNLYPEYNPLLLDSSLWESRAYFSKMLKSDLGAAYISHSGFAMLNQRLAELYDIPGVTGNHIRMVKLPQDSVRGGFLTQAAVLKTTANGTVTSPVVRGDYVQVHFLGDPPPPPPPSIPAVEPDISGAITIRDQLAQHSQDKSCAACHAKIDPPGFALESFDVMGAYRERYRSLKKGDTIPNLFFDGRPSKTKFGLPVDASGEMRDGSTFSNIRGFKGILLKRNEQVARNLLELLITYSTGAPVGFADEALVDEMMEGLSASQYGLRSMIHAIVQSPLFLDK